MARIRSIKPELWTSSDFVHLSVAGRLAFICLISLADDEGRLKTNAEHLARTHLRGISRSALDAQLVQMSAQGMISTYTVEGVDCIALTNWLVHQKIDHPTPSRIPEPPHSPKPRERSPTPRESSRLSARAPADRIRSDRKGSLIPSVGSPSAEDAEHKPEGNGMLKASLPRTDDPNISPGAHTVLAGYQRLVGHGPTAVDVGRAEDYVMSLQPRLDPPAIVSRMEAHVAYCKQQKLPIPQTLAGFWDTLRRESEHQADVIGHTGVSKRSA